MAARAERSRSQLCIGAQAWDCVLLSSAISSPTAGKPVTEMW